MGNITTEKGWRKRFLLWGFVLTVLLFAVLFGSFSNQTSHAATTLPTKMNFQGRATDAGGTVLANGTYNMRFKIYNALTSGTLQWSEDRLVSATQGVVVTNGLFSVQLGSITSLPASIFTSNSLYFEVEFPTPATATSSSPSWTELPMTPRNQLATSAYAYNAETLDGIDSDAFAKIGSANAFTGANSIDVSNANAFQVKTGSTNLFNVSTSSSTITIGQPDTTGALLVLDTKTSAGDPTGADGAMYYNSNTSKFRCYQAGAWADCISSGGASLSANNTFTGTNNFQNTADSASAFSVKNQTGASLMNVDTTNSRVSIGTADGADARLYIEATGAASTWTARTAAEANTWYSVTYGNGLFVAVSIDGTNRVMSAAGPATALQLAGTAKTGDLKVGGTAQFSDTVAIAGDFTAGNGLFKVDSATATVRVGTAVADANGIVFILDTKNTAGDPTGTNGAMYYNSNANKFRCYQNGAWTDCIGAGGGGGTLQDAYTASSSPATITTTAAKGVAIAAGAVPTADIFSISNAGQGVTTAGVNALGINYVGGTGAVESEGIRVDYTPGGSSGSQWSGMRIVTAVTGAATGVTSNGLKIEGPTTPGLGTDIGLRVASGFDIGLDIGSGGLQLSDMAEPAAPSAAGDLRVYAKTNAGRTMLKIKGNAGVDVSLQPFLGSNRVTLAQPFASSTSFATGSYFGMAAPTIGSFTAGTATASTAFISTPVTFTNLYTSIRRGGVNTSTGAGTSGGIRGGTTNPNYRGNGNATGGFYYVSRFGVKTNQTGSRVFSGLYGSTAAFPNSEPSTLLNIAGVGCDAADSSFSFMSNDNSGVTAEVALGANFPCTTSSADMYELRLFSAPSASIMYYSLARLNTTDFVEGSVNVSANLPVNTTAIYPYTWINNGATAAQASLDFASLYIETDN